MAMIKKKNKKQTRQKNRVLYTNLNYSGSWKLCSLAESTAHYFSTVSQSIKNPVKKGQMRADKIT